MMEEPNEGIFTELNSIVDNDTVDAPIEIRGPVKPWYRRWWAITLYVIFGLIAALLFALGMCVIFCEFDQCERSCRLEFCTGVNDTQCLLNGQITGRRKSPGNRKKCMCSAPDLFQGEVEIDRMAKPADTWAMDASETRYCAVPPDSTDGYGITYENRTASTEAGAFELHLGPCGACSSESDKIAYNKTAQTLTKLSTKAAFASIFATRYAKNVMLESGLSDQCIDCWVENMHQTLIHCFGTCMFSSRAGCNSKGELTDCLYCDEVHSGVYFRRCAGMTRRRAGIVTDICRKPGEVVV